MKAFIKYILGFMGDDLSLNEGVLGITKAYYGCVEAQGHGTLHCHMLVWLHSALDPNKIKNHVMAGGDDAFRDKLLAFINDALSNYIPDVPMDSGSVMSDGFHAAAVQGNNTGILTGQPKKSLMERDLHNLVVDCQVHKHTKTCYKYWHYPELKVCHFDLDEDNVLQESYFDYEKGELVNNFNETILCAVQCNMDIKFIGSGASAKAILYYITDYITKLQLKTHVMYTALELSVKKLGEYDSHEDEITCCTYTMLSHQELLVQQVSSYLLGHEDHFKSHEFQGLYWTSFESYIDLQDPSPECKPVKGLTGGVPTSAMSEMVEENNDTDELEDELLSDDYESDIEHTDGIEDVTEHAVQNDDGEDVIVDDDEVVVGVDSKVADYTMRGPALQDISL
ncbi:hypothetical protein EDD85DRAFT_918712 [Armillaria nabsnona]|nr:hypothetical protein EDD85DRAFT_918712 [Armillaria nabsnona]